MGEAARRRAAAARSRSTGEISIRDAAPGEGQRVRHLLDRYVGGEDSDEAAGRIDRPHNRNDGLWTQLVAERDGMIVGALTVGDIFGKPHIRQQPAAAAMIGRHAEIINLVVHPEARGQRLGRRLMVEAERRYEDAGYQLLSGEFVARSPHLRAYYEDAGFTVGRPGRPVVIVFGAETVSPLEPHDDACLIWKVVRTGPTVVDFSSVPAAEGTRLVEQAIREAQEDTRTSGS
ncbi:GNAT family N-acetyltransferase [Streptomyces europaeiscabiei]|uniref:GNAT family N-acetyltransferase n=1 Tax=Streptomyces europaeiscabiei TaxID=146819 RepID=UPI0029AF563C|nr:GNAT family N-acetyltransferase [Streptomyces europaeiscabiei]MDX3583045.1 GNAT family N-acetyltransferase [Streptomyces europaeiscabiei]MDX3613660.1 GNAT family N-acetyltransferase [Streptomyces europaeiscabiei]